jgi:hypothetical protein
MLLGVAPHRSPVQHQLLFVKWVLPEKQWILNEKNSVRTRFGRVIGKELMRIDQGSCSHTCISLT